MALMTQTRLTMAAHNCRNILERIAQKIPSGDLMDAVNHYDADAVDDILEGALCSLMNTDNLFLGLEQFCQNFGIAEDRSGMDAIDYILLIDRHRDEIDQQLKNAGV